MQHKTFALQIQFKYVNITCDMTEFTSRLKGFYSLSCKNRIEKLKLLRNLTNDEVQLLRGEPKLLDLFEEMIENTVGIMQIPIGLATNFLIDGKERLVTMAVEESSVVAAASNLAKMTLPHGGFKTSYDGSYMIGQIQIVNLQMPYFAAQQILNKKQEILDLANEQDPILIKYGGGAVDVKVRILNTSVGEMLIVHLIVNTLDAMGANATNTMVEAVSPFIKSLTNGKIRLRILSNLADKRIVRSRAIFDKDMLGGEKIVHAIIDAWAFAEADIYRAATHNKGIMNAISAVTLATGNDWRAVEAGCHVYASKTGHYSPLTKFSITNEGHLAGTIEVPLSLGIIGGASKIHPTARLNLKIMDIKNIEELSTLVASAGLAQNVAALRALVAEGIQKGHMKLHAKNIAKQAGASSEESDEIAQQMIKSGKIRMDVAEKLLNQLRLN